MQFISSIKNALRSLCCGEQDDEPVAFRPVISSPTEFHKVELQLHGVGPEDLKVMRAEQGENQKRLFASLGPVKREDGTTPVPLVDEHGEPTQLAWVSNNSARVSYARPDNSTDTSAAANGDVGTSRDFAYRRE